MKSTYPLVFSKRKIQNILLTIVLLLSFFSGSLPQAQAQEDAPLELFSDAGNVNPSNGAAAKPYVMRSRYVKVNVGVLTSEGRTNRKANSGPEVKLNLFSDVAYTGVVERFEQTSPTSSTWNRNAQGRGPWLFLSRDFRRRFYCPCRIADRYL